VLRLFSPIVSEPLRVVSCGPVFPFGRGCASRFAASLIAPRLREERTYMRALRVAPCRQLRETAPSWWIYTSARDQDPPVKPMETVAGTTVHLPKPPVVRTVVVAAQG